MSKETVYESVDQVAVNVTVEAFCVVRFLTLSPALYVWPLYDQPVNVWPGFSKVQAGRVYSVSYVAAILSVVPLAPAPGAKAMVYVLGTHLACSVISL